MDENDKETWSCSHSENQVGCHRPAVYIIQLGALRVGSCFFHRQAILESFRPAIHTWNLDGTQVVENAG
jgi:hypothetical protein